MPNLPSDGQDPWGDALNTFLEVAHNPDGSLRNITIRSSNALTEDTLQLGDAENEVEYTNVGDTNGNIQVTIPANVDVGYPVGTVINIRQMGSGQPNLIGETGVRVVGSNGLATRAQYSTISLIQSSLDFWVVGGDSTP